MKLLFLFILCCSSVPLYAQVSYETFYKQGKELYAKGEKELTSKEYDAAKESFENAGKRFEAAKKSPDTPRDNDFDTWIKKCQDAVKRVERERKQNNSVTPVVTEKPTRSKEVVQTTPPVPTQPIVIQEAKLEDNEILQITGIKFQNTERNGNKIPGSEGKLLTNMKYLQPEITYNNISSENRTITLHIKILEESNNRLLTDIQSSNNYTYTYTFLVPGSAKNYKQVLGNFGQEDGKMFSQPGNYLFEVWCAGTKISFHTFSVNQEEIILPNVDTGVVDTGGIEEEVKLEVDYKSLNFNKNGETKIVTVTTNVGDDWTLWGEYISFGKITKVSKNTIKITCDPNLSSVRRSDYFKVIAGDKEIQIAINQEARKVKRIYHWGLSAGYVQKRFNYRDNDGLTQSYGYLSDSDIPGVQLGIKYEGYFSPKVFGLGMTTGLYYEYYSQKSDVIEDSSDGDYTYSLKEHSFYLPVALIYRFDFTEDFNIVLHAGAGFNYGLFAKLEGKDVGEKDTWFTETELYDYDEWGLRRIHVSAEFGVGLRYKRIGLDAKFGTPLTDWSNDVYYSEKMNKGLTIGLSVMF